MTVEELVARAEAAMQRRGAKPDSGKPLKVVYSNDLKGLAMVKGNTIYISGNGPEDWSSLEALAPWVYHEVAHFYTEDRSGGGHNDEWAANFLPSVHEDLDEKGVGVVMNHFTKKYPELDTALALGSQGRHSTGGTVDMTHQEAVQLLIDRGGWSPEEAERLVSSVALGGGITGNTSGEIDPEALKQYLPEGVDPAFEPSSRRPSQTGRAEDRLEESEFATIQSAVEAQATGVPLTDDETAAISNPDNRQQILEAIQALQGEQQFNYDWVYNQLQLDAGSLDSSEALLSLIPVLEEVAGIEFEEELSDDELVVKVSEVLARNSGNIMVNAALAEWGRESGHYLSPSEQTFSNLVLNGATAARARTLQLVGEKFEIDPERLYQMQQASKTNPSEFYSGMHMFRIARDFKQGLDLYEGSNVLASLHVFDPGLAAKLRNDPYSLDSGELRRALGLLGQGEGSGQEGVATGDPQLDWLKTRLAGGYQATASVDSDAVKEAVSTLAQAWNLVGAEGAAVEVTKEMISGAVARARASLPNPFGPVQSGVNVIDSAENLQAQIRQQLRQSGEYGELFGHKAAAESEEEYVARFENRSQSILGDDQSSVVRNAMRSGNVNSVYQQGLLTEVGESSTRFQEIMARNAQVFREML